MSEAGQGCRQSEVTPRGMTADRTGQLMCGLWPKLIHGFALGVEGLVTRCLVTQPKLLYSMHVHKETDDSYVEQRDHRDTTSLDATRKLTQQPCHVSGEHAGQQPGRLSHTGALSGSRY